MCCRATLFIQVKEIVTGVFGLVCKEKCLKFSFPLPLYTYGVLVRRCTKHARIRFACVTGRTIVNRFSGYFLYVCYW